MHAVLAVTRVGGYSPLARLSTRALKDTETTRLRCVAGLLRCFDGGRHRQVLCRQGKLAWATSTLAAPTPETGNGFNYSKVNYY